MVWSKRSLLALGLFAFAYSAQAKVLISKAKNTTSYDITIDDVIYEEATVRGRTFLKASLTGVEGYAAITHDIGMPQLPVVRLYVNAPADQIKMQSAQAVNLAPDRSGLQIMPSQRDVVKRPKAFQPLRMNRLVYRQDRFLPANLANNFTIETVGSIRGTPRQLITLYPFKYNPKTRVASFTKTFQVEVEGSQVTQDQELGTIAFVVGRDFANSPSLAEYMAYKNEIGFQTKKIVYGVDATSIDGVRTALKTLLADASVNLTYAVIIGDKAQVPAKTATHMTGVTDHYYRAIDTNNYETDLNGPDIGVGRISVENESQLAAVLQKYLRYQKKEFSNQTWLSGAAFLATSDSGYYQTAEGTHDYVVDTYTNQLGYLGQFPQANMAGGDKLYAITHSAENAHVMDALQGGRSFVIYSGHGYPGGWADPSLDANDVMSLNDPDYMPFVAGFACDTANYSSSSIAEAWQRHVDGSIAYFGSYDSSFWDEDDILQKKLFDGIFARNITQVGGFLNFALSELWLYYGGNSNSKYYWESYTTFGDPSVAVWLKN